MGNTSNKSRFREGKSSSERNLQCGYDRLAMTLIARASDDYRDVSRQLRDSTFRNERERRSLESRKRYHAAELQRRDFVVNRLLDAMPVFADVTGKDLVERLDRLVAEGR
jgi:hypothetical protein